MHNFLTLQGPDLLDAIDVVEKALEPDHVSGYTEFYIARKELSELTWDCYSAAASQSHGTVSLTGIAYGTLGNEIAAEFRDTLANSKITKLRADDFSVGYMASRPNSVIESLNQCNEYRIFEPKMKSLVGDFLSRMAREIEIVCGHAWRVGSIRQFYLKPGAPTGRHTDGWPMAMKKLFILPNGATPETGTTWFRLKTGEELAVDCPEPLWLIFENSAVEHALIAPLKGRRDTIEVDLLPCNVTNTALVDAGLNGWYPWFPTAKALVHGCALAARLAMEKIGVDVEDAALAGHPSKFLGPLIALKKLAKFY